MSRAAPWSCAWSELLRYAGIGLALFAFVAGWSRERLWSESDLPPGLTTAAALYASAFFWLYSDPEVVGLD